MGKVAIVVGAVLLAATLLASPGVAATDPGFGKAQAQMLMLDPRSAQLSFGVRFGSTVSDHRNQVARAQAWSTDYGLIGGALTAAPCDGGGEASIKPEDLPRPYRADSREPKDNAEKTVVEGPITQSVRAQPIPSAVATSRLAEVDLPGLLTIRGSTSRTSSGVDANGIAEVKAEVNIAELSLLGLVSLGGLHWEAVHRADTGPVGKFTLGTASIAGVPIPSQDASAVIDAVNALLSNLGVVILPPVTHVEDATIFVDALQIGVAPNQLRDQVSAQVISAIQPIREALFQALLDASCNSGGAITVVDLLLGSVTGGGSFTASLGGAQAELSDAPVGTGFGGTGTGGTTLGGGPTGGTTGRSGLPDLPDTAVTTGPATTPGSVGTTPTRRTSAADDDDDRDAALAVALTSILLGGCLLEADRRKMRQAGVAVSTLAPSEGSG